jgi:predicted DCC family thiol-disulfide oxidoreductase YuxK
VTAAGSSIAHPRAARAARWTSAPGGERWIALYDGDCRFCTQQVRQLERLVGRERVEPVSFQGEGVLARFPGVSHEACMLRMHVVRPDGRVFAGAEAVARAVTRIPFVGWLGFLYYVPGLRQLTDLGYRLVAKYRYRIAGRRGACDEGTCSLHE